MAQALRRKLEGKTHDERKEIIAHALKTDGLTRCSALDLLRNHVGSVELTSKDVDTLLSQKGHKHNG